MQEMRELLQQTIQLQQQTEADIAALTQAQARTQQQIDSNAQSIGETDAIAKSNARSIEAWESRIEENRVEAEEERSELRVGLNDLRESVAELVRLSQRNEVEHELFRRRFEAIDPLANGDQPTFQLAFPTIPPVASVGLFRPLEQAGLVLPELFPIRMPIGPLHQKEVDRKCSGRRKEHSQ